MLVVEQSSIRVLRRWARAIAEASAPGHRSSSARSAG